MSSEQKKHALMQPAFLLRTGIAFAMILLAAVLRMVPHPWNLTPIGAMALFSGSMFRRPWIAFLLPLAGLFAGDVFAGFHKLISENRTVVRIGGAVFVGALQFFAITNFAVWAVGGFYPKTAAGLAACFAAGVPYFWNTLAGDALYAGIFFGGFALAERIVAPLPEPREGAQT
jgi:hypothetical protein